jgi:hypothetical protein
MNQTIEHHLLSICSLRAERLAVQPPALFAGRLQLLVRLAAGLGLNHNFYGKLAFAFCTKSPQIVDEVGPIGNKPCRILYIRNQFATTLVDVVALEIDP